MISMALTIAKSIDRNREARPIAPGRVVAELGITLQATGERRSAGFATTEVGGSTGERGEPSLASADVLVSNTQKTDDGGNSCIKDFDLAKGLTNGTGASLLESIKAKLAKTSLNDAVLSVVTATVVKRNPTGTAMATLSSTDTISGIKANYMFTAPANTTLEASPRYCTALTSTHNNIRWDLTSTDAEYSGGESDLAIEAPITTTLRPAPETPA